MTWEEALEIRVKATGNERFRALCDASHPDHAVHRRRVLEKAGQPTLQVRAVPAQQPLPPGEWKPCGGCPGLNPYDYLVSGDGAKENPA